MGNTTRIKQGNSCNFMSLTETEKHLYHGCGYAIAYVDNDEVTKLEYLEFSVSHNEGEPVKTAHKMLQDALSHGHAYLAMMSCFDACDPELITEENAKELFEEFANEG